MPHDDQTLKSTEITAKIVFFVHTFKPLGYYDSLLNSINYICSRETLYSPIVAYLYLFIYLFEISPNAYIYIYIYTYSIIEKQMQCVMRKDG